MEGISEERKLFEITYLILKEVNNDENELKTLKRRINSSNIKLMIYNLSKMLISKVYYAPYIIKVLNQIEDALKLNKEEVIINGNKLLLNYDQF